jgi:signal transduction histidine kinase
MRLTGWYLAILAALLIVLGLAIYAVVVRQLNAGVDADLRGIAPRARADVINGDAADIRDITQQGPYGIVFSQDGLQPPVRTPKLRRLRLPVFAGLEAAAQSAHPDLRTLSTGLGPVRVYSQVWRRLDGTVQYVQIVRSLKPEHDAAGRLLRVLVFGGLAGIVLAGIGGWFLAGKALAPVSEAFRRQEAFVGDASHELRTPLAVIRANAEFLANDQPGNAEVRDIVHETDRLSALVDGLLALARGDRTELGTSHATVDLLAIVGAACNSLRPLAADRGVELHLTGEPVAVAGDADQLRQLIVILLDNALRYTPPGGRVDVGVEAAGGRALLTVRDTGIGIEPEALPKVFDRFYRADDARNRDSGGVGLGLSIARELVAAHGGSIGAQSEPGRGSTFTVELPAR